MIYRNIIKRILDLTLSVIAFVVLIPVFFVVAIAVKADSRGPVLFSQLRIGKDKKVFNIYKFRTMFIETPKECPTGLLEDPDQYITKIGNILRKTSIDELPQIINIIKGEMSIVGPRPVICSETELIEARDACGANELRPGLTGWAQINGRDVMHHQVKAKYDGEYAQKISFLFDAIIFFKSIRYVLRRDGIYEGKPEHPHHKDHDHNSDDDRKKADE